MKKKKFIELMVFLLLIWGGTIAVGFYFPFCQIIAFFYPPLSFLISVRYLFVDLKIDRIAFGLPEKQKWIECIVIEVLTVLCETISFCIHRQYAAVYLPFMVPLLYFFIYANLFSPHSLRRKKARWIASAFSLALSILIIVLTVNNIIADNNIIDIAVSAIVFVILLLWIISIPISYFTHVKIIQYPGENETT